MQGLLRIASNASSLQPPSSPGSAPVNAEEESDLEPTMHLVVSAFFLSMVAAGVCLALICSYNGGTIGMAAASDCAFPEDQTGEEEVELELELDASVEESPRAHELEL